jgi:hypothetical protein
LELPELLAVGVQILTFVAFTVLLYIYGKRALDELEQKGTHIVHNVLQIVYYRLIYRPYYRLIYHPSFFLIIVLFIVLIIVLFIVLIL